MLLVVILCRPQYTATDERTIVKKKKVQRGKGRGRGQSQGTILEKLRRRRRRTKNVLVQPVYGPKYELQTSRAQSSSAAPLSQFKSAYNVTSEFGMWSEEIAIQMSKLSHFELLNVGETRYRSYYGLKAS